MDAGSITAQLSGCEKKCNEVGSGARGEVVILQRRRRRLEGGRRWEGRSGKGEGGGREGEEEGADTRVGMEARVWSRCEEEEEGLEVMLVGCSDSTKN